MTPLTPDEVIARCGLPVSGQQEVSTGGSPGERGTVTHKTSADEERPERCPRCDSSSPNLHPAMQFEGEVQPCPHPWHGEADDPCEPSKSNPVWCVTHQSFCRAIAKNHLPFPNAYPGPQVDGQPTWGAYLRDVPADGFEMSSLERDDWHAKGAEEISFWDQDFWVLVRRIPQPATERVPWHEAWGRHRVEHGRIEAIEHKVDGRRGTWHFEQDLAHRFYDVDEDGTVEVLVENEEPGT